MHSQLSHGVMVALQILVLPAVVRVHLGIEAAHTSGKYQLVAVYSRKLETAATFASRYQDIQLFDQVEDFFKSSFDVVYIASPNSLHFVKQRLPCLLASMSFLKNQLSLSHKSGWI